MREYERLGEAEFRRRYHSYLRRGGTQELAKITCRACMDHEKAMRHEQEQSDPNLARKVRKNKLLQRRRQQKRQLRQQSLAERNEERKDKSLDEQEVLLLSVSNKKLKH